MATPVKSADQYILQDFVPLLENIIISKENEAKKTEQILKKIKSIPKNLETSFVFGWLYIRFYDLAYSIAKTKDQLKATAKRKVFSDIILNHLKFIYSEFGQTAQAEQLKKYGSGNGYYKFLEFSIIGTKITIELERFTIHSKSRSKQETGKSGNEFYRLFTKDGAEALKTILDQKYGKGTGKREALLNYIASIIALEDVKVFLSELKKINSVNFNFIKDEFSEKGISNILIPNLEKRLQILNANTEFLISKGIVKAEDPSQLKSSIEKDIPVERTTRMTIDSTGYQIGSKVDQKTKAHPFYDLPSIKKQTYYTDGGNPVTLYLLFLKEIGITNEEYNELEEIFNSEQFDEFLITRILTDIEIYKNFKLQQKFTSLREFVFDADLASTVKNHYLSFAQVQPYEIKSALLTASPFLKEFFGPILSIFLDFIPFVGAAKGIVEAATGEDPVTGEKLATWQRVLAILPLGAKYFGKTGKVASIGARILNKTGRVSAKMGEAVLLLTLAIRSGNHPINLIEKVQIAAKLSPDTVAVAAKEISSIKTASEFMRSPAQLKLAKEIVEVSNQSSKSMSKYAETIEILKKQGKTGAVSVEHIPDVLPEPITKHTDLAPLDSRLTSGRATDYKTGPPVKPADTPDTPVLPPAKPESKGRQKPQRKKGKGPAPKKIKISPSIAKELKLSAKDVRIIEKSAEIFVEEMAKLSPKVKAKQMTASAASIEAHAKSQARLEKEFQGILSIEAPLGVDRGKSSHIPARSDISVIKNGTDPAKITDFQGPTIDFKATVWLKDGLLKTPRSQVVESLAIQRYETLSRSLGVPVFIINKDGKIFTPDLKLESGWKQISI